MANILDILTRAQALRQETALNSITPDRAGGIMYDTLILINQMQLEGGSLLISKVYSSVAAMEADTTPTSDLTGRALRPGQLAVIVPSSSTSSDMGSVYRYNEPGSWTLCGKIGGLPMDTVPTEGSSNGITSGAVYQTKQALEGEVSQLEAKVTDLDEDVNGKPKNYSEGHYLKNDGTIGDDSTCGLSDFIPYIPGNDVLWKFDTHQRSGYYIGFFRSDKSYITGSDFSSQYNAQYGGRLISAAQIAQYAPNAAYIRASFTITFADAEVFVGNNSAWKRQEYEPSLLSRINELNAKVESEKFRFRPEISYTQNSFASYNNGLVIVSGKSYSDYKLGVIDVTGYVGQEILISCISKSSTNPSSVIHAFANDSDELVGNTMPVTELTNPITAIVPNGATKLFLTCYIPLNTDEPFVVVKESIDKIVESYNGLQIEEEQNVVFYAERQYVTKNGAGQLVFASSSSYMMYEVDGLEEHNWQDCVIDCITKSESNPSNVGHAFVDSDGELIGNIITVKPSQNPIKVTIPTGAVKIFLTYFITGNTKYPSLSIFADSQTQGGYDNTRKRIDELAVGVTENHWDSKRILWLGTSIPWGQTDENAPGTAARAENPYPRQVCKKLNSALIDSTHGGLSQQALYDEGTGLLYPRPYGTTCLSVAECTAAYNAGLTQTNLQAMSFENSVLGKNADIYIFDVEPNNNTDGSEEDLNNFNWYLWKYNDDSDFADHRTSYIGGLIYVIDKLLTEKPDAVIVFVGEYVSLQSSGYQNSGVRPLTKALCEKFHIHYIDLAEKLGYNGKNKGVWVNTDMVHPKQITYDRMAKMLIHELLLIA